MPLLDFPISIYPFNLNIPVRVRFLRNISWVLRARSLSPELGALFLALSKTFDLHSFWDVDANIGYYSWLMLSHNNDLQVVLFEPDPDNISLIKETIKNNRIVKAYLVEAAASDCNSLEDFALDPITGATGTLECTTATFIERNFRVESVSKIKVKTVSLDRFWKDKICLKPDLLKIDVEGAEPKVFDGAWQLIESIKPILIFECYFSSQQKNSYFQKLEELGYQLFNVESHTASITMANNVLALPPQYLDETDQLLQMWQEQIEKWKG
ncbi:FkbM family methyltransferase [Trichothermofontia sp.]